MQRTPRGQVPRLRVLPRASCTSTSAPRASGASVSPGDPQGMPGTAGDHLLRDTVVQLVAHQKRSAALPGRDYEAVVLEDRDPGRAAATVRVLHHVDRRSGRPAPTFSGAMRPRAPSLRPGWSGEKSFHDSFGFLSDGYGVPSGQRSTRLSRKALVITETEDRLIAAAAIIGESSRPVKGYSSPAAIGTPSAL